MKIVMKGTCLFYCFATTLIVTVFFNSCKKSNEGGITPTPADTTVVIAPAIDPPTASTIGFFLNDWQPVTFTAPANIPGAVPPATANTITIDRSAVITKIPRGIFGNNANLWMTQLVTETALMNHLTAAKPHIVRFPGGSISDVFFWNAPANTPPADAPVNLVAANGSSAAAGFWFGKNTASWTLSVDNYYSMLQQTGNEGLITINYGYARYGKSANPVAAAAHLAADWVRYDNGRTKYWEIGNENFGDWEAGYRINLADNQDGQPEFLSGQLYGQHFKVFADSMRKAATEIGKIIYIGAVTSESVPLPWWTNTARNWNTGLMGAAVNYPDYYVVHNYYTDYQTNATTSQILATASTVTSGMMNYVQQTITANGALVKPIALDEWNITSQGSKQQVSFVNGLHAAILVGDAIKNKYGMTSRWDMANAWDNGNDHGLFSQGEAASGESKWNPRPAFYFMYYMSRFLGDRCVSSTSSTADLETCASSFSSGETAVSIVNKSATATTVEIVIKNFRKGNKFYWYTLTGGTDNGEFSRKVLVNGFGPSGDAGGPANYTGLDAFSASTSNGIRLTIPGRSAVFAVVDKQ
jgi:alpha-L-arabinofuranosidase